MLEIITTNKTLFKGISPYSLTLKNIYMKHILLLVSSFFLFFTVYSQDATIKITNHDPIPDPLAVCIGETLNMSIIDLNMDNYEAVSNWIVCSEEPDLIGYSNSEKWVTFGYGSESESITIESEIYILAQISDLNFGYATPVIHITVKGTIPELVYEEADVLFCESSTVNLSVTPNNLGDGNYKWFMNGQEIATETNANYSFTEAATYSVSAKDATSECPDNFIPSQEVEFNTIKPAIYGDYKADLNRVSLSTDEIYASYQWYSGADESSLVAIDAQTAVSHNATTTETDTYYAVEITTENSCTAMSDIVLINNILYSVPVVTEPTNTFVCNDGSVLLEVENDAYASYQWYKNGNSIWGATTTTLTVDNGYSTGSGSYSVKVKTVLDDAEEFESNAITIEVAPFPKVFIIDNATTCPNGVVTLDSEGEFDSFQWYVNDVKDFATAVKLTGKTEPSMDINVGEEVRYYYLATTLNSCEAYSTARTITPFSIYPPTIYASGWQAAGEICFGSEIGLLGGGYNVSWQWYLNGEVLEGVTEKNPTVSQVGSYELALQSEQCPNLDPVMCNNAVIIDYKVKPTYTYMPKTELWQDNPNNPIFCNGTEIELTVDNSDNYVQWQWLGKLYPESSTTDDWTVLEDEDGDNTIFNFTNGQIPFMHFKVKVDSLMADGTYCTGISELITLDSWAFMTPSVAYENNAELCEEGDEAKLELAFPGPWVKYEWYKNGDLIPDANESVYNASEVGDYILICYPDKCPHIPISSGSGVWVNYMQDAEIIQDEIDPVVYALPLPVYNDYSYQWLYSATNPGEDITKMAEIDSEVTMPWVVYNKNMDAGYYVVKVTNLKACNRYSEVFGYNVTGIDKISSISVNLFPNPVVDNLSISLSETANVEQIELYNTAGTLMATEKNINKTVNMSMNNYDNGIYIVRIKFKNNYSTVYKVVKQ